MDENLTPEQETELAQYLEQQGYPTPQEKFGLFNFFGKIVKSKTTRKTSFLGEDELNTVRNLERARIFAEEMGYDLVAKYIEKRAEIILGTGLSREGFLIKSAITSKRDSRTSIKTGAEDKKKWLKDNNKI